MTRGRPTTRTQCYAHEDHERRAGNFQNMLNYTNQRHILNNRMYEGTGNSYSIGRATDTEWHRGSSQNKRGI